MLCKDRNKTSYVLHVLSLQNHGHFCVPLLLCEGVLRFCTVYQAHTSFNVGYTE